jgi:hypothetical protein
MQDRPPRRSLPRLRREARQQGLDDPWVSFSLAATGLVIIMTGATVITSLVGAVAPALVPLTVGLLSAFVAYGRRRPAPSRGSSHSPVFVPVS